MMISLRQNGLSPSCLSTRLQRLLLVEYTELSGFRTFAAPYMTLSRSDPSENVPPSQNSISILSFPGSTCP